MVITYHIRLYAVIVCHPFKSSYSNSCRLRIGSDSAGHWLKCQFCEPVYTSESANIYWWTKFCVLGALSLDDHFRFNFLYLLNPGNCSGDVYAGRTGTAKSDQTEQSGCIKQRLKVKLPKILNQLFTICNL